MFFIIPIPRIRVRPRPQKPPPPAAHFALQPTTQDGETALFTDSRIGFSHALPGWPQATNALAGPGEPPADALIQFWDFPMWIRYRVERMAGPAPSAMHAALDWAARYARNRSRGNCTVAPVNADRVQAWCVDAAASSTYPLAQHDAHGADHEDLTVLLHAGTILTVTRRHSGAAQDWVRHAAFRAATDATMLWNPQRFRYEAKIWPPSTFLEATLAPQLVAPRQQALPGIASALRLDPTQQAALGGVLRAMIESQEPPWQAIPADAKSHWARALAGAVTTPHVATFLSQGLAEVQTAHDLRGFAVMTGTAMSQPAA